MRTQYIGRLSRTWVQVERSAMLTIREIAETIRAELEPGAELSDALGVGEAGRARDEISNLLARQDAGEQLEDQLVAVLAARELTRERLDALLPESLPSGERGVFASYEQLPGRYRPPGIEIYDCPQGDYQWPRFDAGEPVPSCPTHGIPLVRSDS